ncbi:9201_t:CDS:1, partial [Paraglomus occultum]
MTTPFNLPSLDSINFSAIQHQLNQQQDVVTAATASSVATTPTASPPQQLNQESQQ